MFTTYTSLHCTTVLLRKPKLGEVVLQSKWNLHFTGQEALAYTPAGEGVSAANQKKICGAMPTAKICTRKDVAMFATTGERVEGEEAMVCVRMCGVCLCVRVHSGRLLQCLVCCVNRVCVCACGVCMPRRCCYQKAKAGVSYQWELVDGWALIPNPRSPVAGLAAVQAPLQHRFVDGGCGLALPLCPTVELQLLEGLCVGALEPHLGFEEHAWCLYTGPLAKASLESLKKIRRGGGGGAKSPTPFPQPPPPIPIKQKFRLVVHDSA